VEPQTVEEFKTKETAIAGWNRRALRQDSSGGIEVDEYQARLNGDRAAIRVIDELKRELSRLRAAPQESRSEVPENAVELAAYRRALEQIIRSEDCDPVQVAHEAITPFTDWAGASEVQTRAIERALASHAEPGAQIPYDGVANRAQYEAETAHAAQAEPDAHSELGRDDDAPRKDFERQQYKRAETPEQRATRHAKEYATGPASAAPEPAAQARINRWIAEGRAQGLEDACKLVMEYGGTRNQRVALCRRILTKIKPRETEGK
jgi:predicted transcriptional regulator